MYLGIFLALLGCTCSAIAYTLQKVAHERSRSSATAPASVSDASSSPFWRYWQFPAGLACLICGAILSVVASSMAAQSTLSPLANFTQLINMVLAATILKEPLLWYDIISLFLMSGGTVLAATFSVRVDRKYSVDDVASLFSRPIVSAFFGSIGCCCALVLLWLHTALPASNRMSRIGGGIASVVAVGSAGGGSDKSSSDLRVEGADERPMNSYAPSAYQHDSNSSSSSSRRGDTKDEEGLHMLIRSTSDNASILASSSDGAAPPPAASVHDARSSVDESLKGRGGYAGSAYHTSSRPDVYSAVSMKFSPPPAADIPPSYGDHMANEEPRFKRKAVHLQAPSFSTDDGTRNSAHWAPTRDSETAVFTSDAIPTEEGATETSDLLTDSRTSTTTTKHHQRKTHSPPSASSSSSSSSASSSSTSSASLQPPLSSLVLSTLAVTPSSTWLHRSEGPIHAIIGGIAGGFTGSFVKGVSESISAAVSSSSSSSSAIAATPFVDMILFRPLFWCLVFGLIFFLTTQLRFLNSGLAKHESIKIVPIYQTTIVVSGVLSGLIVWDEMSVQTSTSFFWFLVGLSLSCAGVLVLSFKPNATHTGG